MGIPFDDAMSVEPKELGRENKTRAPENMAVAHPLCDAYISSRDIDPGLAFKSRLFRQGPPGAINSCDNCVQLYPWLGQWQGPMGLRFFDKIFSLGDIGNGIECMGSFFCGVGG